jgi:hypothetical protein
MSVSAPPEPRGDERDPVGSAAESRLAGNRALARRVALTAATTSMRAARMSSSQAGDIMRGSLPA